MTQNHLTGTGIGTVRDDRPAGSWGGYVDRYRRGEWRAPVFRDMVLAEIAEVARQATVLDIGCGRGFDGDVGLQERIAASSGRYVGVEPDSSVAIDPNVHEVHRCLLEDAPLEPGSIDVALAVMVLEHVPEPARFWGKLHKVLRDGGGFWGFTMDARHPFCRLSRRADRLRIKDFYLDLLRGRRGAGQYENYPVHYRCNTYRCNTPEQVARDAAAFREREFVSFSRVGQLDFYLLRPLRPIGHHLDHRAIRGQRPGSLLAIRLVK